MAKRKTTSAEAIPDSLMIERAIVTVRGQRLLIDSDLASLYGVTTAAINQTVKRNANRFPDDFSFLLSRLEFTTLISQSVISKRGRGGRQQPPRVFTEHGVAMFASVLHSLIAIDVNIAIVRAFVRLRRLMFTPGELVEQLTKLADTVQLHDHQIKVIADVLQPMVEQPRRQSAKLNSTRTPRAPVLFNAC